MRGSGIIAVIAAIALFAASGCSGDRNSGEVDSCLEFLYAYMKPEDDLLHTRDWWEAEVRRTLEVRDRMGWGVPEREFRYFVLPPRATDGWADDFRATWSDSLCRRVAGMSMEEAAVELNFWCLEQAAFGENVADSPLGTVALGTGTCNQLSELLVCALRSAGIPARLVIAVWAHKSGQHAWVEAWIDGQWCYMGGAEPGPRVNFAWFYKDASCVMLAPIYVYGQYDGPEYVLERTPEYTMISNLEKYAPVKELRVDVLDSSGNPLAGVPVEFIVGKAGRKSSIYSAFSQSDGTVRFQTGLGELAVLSGRDSLCGLVKVGRKDTAVATVLCTDRREAFHTLDTMTLVAPSPSLVPGTPAGYEQWLSGNERDSEADSIRAANHRI